jgi:thymidylate synthase (FAD)
MKPVAYVTDEQLDQIKESRETQTVTRRVSSLGLEEILHDFIPILDHGFIRVTDYAGAESTITNAARVSYGTGTKSIKSDAGLLRYLLRHHHTTPFEQCQITLHCKLPIFVARQWIRHRMARVNEYSARYSILDKEFYIPDAENIQPQSIENKQGRSGELTYKQETDVQDILIEHSDEAYNIYQLLLAEDEVDGIYSKDLQDPSFPGIARESARMVLPVNYYTQWYWTTDLHNLMKFLKLRADPHAQFEIRQYADVIQGILGKWMPSVHDAFVDYWQDAVTLSGPQQRLLSKILDSELIRMRISNMENNDPNMSVREFSDTKNWLLKVFNDVE